MYSTLTFWRPKIHRRRPGPLCTRVDFTRMIHTHGDKEQFPYTTDQLAHALYFLCENPELLDEIEELDQQLPPSEFNGNDDAVTEWYTTVEKEQMKVFHEKLENVN